MRWLVFLLIIFSSSSFAFVRIENEYKLVVREDKIDEIWKYISNKNSFFINAGFDIQVSTEFFADIYFDTSDYALLKNENSLRRRSRYYSKNPKLEKNLIQFKLSQKGLKNLQRSEIKFEVRDKLKSAHFGTRPDLLIINSDKPAYHNTLQELGIDKKALRSTLQINQKRRRVYLSFEGKEFATLSLDETESQKLWITERFTELEIELNENLYTHSSVAEREFMLKKIDEIKKTIEAEFPYAKIDLTPKYNKMFSLLVKDRPWYFGLITLESWFN